MTDHIQIGDRRPWAQYQVGASGQGAFPFLFPIFAADDIEVYVDGVRRTAGYAVLGAGASAGGSVTFDPPLFDCVVTLRRRLAVARTTDFQESGEFRARVLNDELDYQTAVIQQIADDVARTLRLPATDPDALLELPDREARRGRYLDFDAATGDLVAATGPAGVPVSGAMEAVVQAASAAAARALLGLEIGLDVLAPDGDGSQLTGLPAPGHACTTTDDDAAPGELGEYVSATVEEAAALALVPSTGKTVAAITLTPGDWDVSGIVGFLPEGGSTLIALFASISLVDGSISSAIGETSTLAYPSGGVDVGTLKNRLPTPVLRVSLAAMTTVYLVAYAAFNGGTMMASGKIRARRVR